jgi:hypothetical protein
MPIASKRGQIAQPLRHINAAFNAVIRCAAQMPKSAESLLPIA